jgi:Mlc titration factor MtfA (ptsG expression regulator)
MFDWWRRLSRAEVIAEPFPEEFREHVRGRVPCAQLLDEAELSKLEALIRIFNSEKHFEGAGGLTLTDEMRIAVAARACLLVLQRMELDEPLYPDLQTIIIYPSTYRTRVKRQEGYVTVDDEQTRWVNRGRAAWSCWLGTRSWPEPPTWPTATTSSSTSLLINSTAKPAPWTARRCWTT